MKNTILFFSADLKRCTSKFYKNKMFKIILFNYTLNAGFKKKLVIILLVGVSKAKLFEFLRTNPDK